MTSRLLAVAGIAILVAGCSGSASPSTPSSATGVSPSPSVSATAAPSTATSVAPSPSSPSPSASGSSSLAITPDASLAALLPHDYGGVRFVVHDLADGGAAPAPLDDVTLRALRDLAAGPAARVSAAWAEPDAAAADPTGGARVIAVRVAGADGMALRRALVAAMLLRPGTSSLGVSDLFGKDALIVGRPALAYAHDDALIIITFTDLPDPQASGPTPTPNDWPFDAFLRDLPASDPFPTPTIRPFPSIDPGLSSPVPDPSAAGLLPATLRGVRLQVITARGPSMFTNPLVGLPAFGLYRSGLDADLEAMSAAAGGGEGLSSFVAVATRVPGVTRLELLSAWFNSLLETGAPVDELEVIDVDGRLVQLYQHGSQAVFATDGLFYWMAYFDVGDFPPPSPPPRPALRDLVMDFVRAIPADVLGGS